jgi:hypothetical protein
MQFISLILIFVALAGCTTRSDQTKIWSDPIESVENNLLPAVIFKGQPIAPKSIYDRMDAYKIPGVSISVFKNGAIEWSNGYGFLSYESSGRTDTYTLFQVPEIERFFATGAIMTLVQRNVIDLNQPVSTYVNIKSDLTIYELLTQQDNLQTLGLLIEKMAGMPYIDFVKEKFIQPFGLRNTTFVNYPSAARGHGKNGEKMPLTQPSKLWSIPSDLGQLSADLINIRNAKTFKVLTKNTIDVLYDLFLQEIERDKKAIVLEGMANGYYAKWILIEDDENWGYSIFINAENGINLAHELERSLSKTYNWEFNHPDTLVRLPLPEEQFKIFQGKFFNEERQNQYEIVAYSDYLSIHPVGEESKKQSFYAISDLQFIEPNTGNRINFNLSESGLIESIVIDGGLLYQKIKAL